MGSNEWLQLDLDLYDQMKNLAEKQREALLGDRLDAFMLHSSRRQSIQNAISSNRKGQPRRAIPQGKGGRKIGNEISRGIRVIEAIQEIDAEIKRIISLKRDALVSQMKEIRHGQKALRVYGKPNRDPGSRFLKTQG